MAKGKIKKISIAGITYALLFAVSGAGIIDRDSDETCGGVERWNVKVVTDERAFDINTSPIITTIDSLDGVSTSKHKIKKDTKRLDIETQVYTIKNCFITHAIKENDNDIHLIIEDGSRNHMIAEIPDPNCPKVKKSRFYNKYKKARSVFMKHENNYDQFRFDITGVLFIDKKHSSNPTGNNPNNIELHPVIELTEVSEFNIPNN